MTNKQTTNKCDHNKDPIFLCLSPQCLAPSPMCLDQCFSLHVHNENERIGIDDLQQLLKLFSNQNAKPKCRSIQQSIFAQFAILKAEFSEILDNLCRILINKIGYPYLNVHGHLSTYKRLKNKQFRKIDQTELIDFVNFTKKKMSDMNIMLSQGKMKQIVKKRVSKIGNNDQNVNMLVKEQRQLYQKEIDFNMKIIQSIQILIRDFQNKAFSFIQEKERNNIKMKCEKDYTEGFSKLKEIVKVAKNRYKAQKDQQLVTKIKEENEQAEFMKQFQQEVKKQNKNDPSVSENTTTQQNQTRCRLKDSRKKERIRNSICNDIGVIKTPLLKRQVSIQRQIVSTAKNRFSLKSQQKKELSDEQDSKDINTHITDISKNKIKTLYNATNSPRKNSIDAKMKSKLINKAGEIKNKNSDESKKYTEEEKISSQAQQNTMSNLLSNKTSIVSQTKKSSDLRQQLFLVQLPSCKELTLQNSPKKIKKQYSHNLNNRQSNQFDLIKKIALIRHKNQQNNNVQEGDLQMQVSLLLLIQAIKAPKDTPGDIKKIITYLQTSIQYCQKNLSASELLAFTYFQSNSPQESLEVCEYFINKNINKLKKQGKISRPDVCMIHLITTKTGALNVLGRFSETIKFIQQGNFIDPEFIYSLKQSEAVQNEIIQNISTSDLIFFKKRQNGISALSKLFKNLADAYNQLGDYDSGIKFYKLSLVECDSFDECYYNLAICYYLNKDYSLAWKQLGKAINFAKNQQTKEQYMQFKRRMEKQANQ